ncbi:MAG: PH domain-containing protein [Acidimicrobiia bacterium]
MTDEYEPSAGQGTEALGDDGWQRLHLGTILDDALQRIPSVLIGLFLIFTSGSGDAAFEFLQLAIGFAAIFPVVTRYLTGRYRVTPELLQWRVGVFKKVHVDLPRHRIQSVDTRISIVGRVLGLQSIVVSSAGGEGEIRIGLIRAPTADQLRTELSPDVDFVPQGERKGDGGFAQEPTEEPKGVEIELATLGASDLGRVVAVDAGRFFGLILIVVVGVAFIAGLAAGLIGAGSLFLIVPLIFGAFGIARGLATEAIGFSSRLVGDQIRVSRGILARSTLEAPLARVQGVTMKRSIVARSIGTERISVDTADVSDEGNRAPGRTQTLVHPIATEGTWRPWASVFLRGLPPEPSEFQRVARVSLRRRWFAAARFALAVWVVVALIGLAVAQPIDAHGWIQITAVAIGVIAPLTFGILETMRYRNERWALGDEQVAFRGGAVTTALTAIPRVRAQGALLRANWFQRRLGVANITVDTASPTVGGTGRDLHLADAEHVAVAVLASADEGGGV